MGIKEGIVADLTKNSDGTGRVFFKNREGKGLLYGFNFADSTNLRVDSPKVMSQLESISGKAFRLIGGVHFETNTSQWEASFGRGQSSTSSHGPFVGCKVQTRDTHGKWEKTMVIGEIPKK